MASLAAVYTPTAHTLAHRARIATTLSTLRRTTPRVPFWQLPAHRSPTLWTLYRGLLRDAPSDIVRRKISWEFRKRRKLTSPADTREELIKAHRWRDTFAKAKAGDIHLQAVLARYTRMLEAQAEKINFQNMVRNELAWQDRLATRPRPTGSYLRATLFNKPMIRLKPQPMHISGMINRRLRSREMRQEQLDTLTELRQDLRREVQFEKALKREEAGFEMAVTEGARDMDRFMVDRISTIRTTFDNDVARINTPYSPELIEQVRAARTQRIKFRTEQKQREERGEVLDRTLKRARKGPPAHVLAEMSPAQRRDDKVARSSVSETGYVGAVKRKLGYKMKSEKWKEEEKELGAVSEKVKMMEEEVRRENERRRKINEKEERALGIVIGADAGRAKNAKTPSQ